MHLEPDSERNRKRANSMTKQWEVLRPAGEQHSQSNEKRGRGVFFSPLHPPATQQRVSKPKQLVQQNLEHGCAFQLQRGCMTCRLVSDKVTSVKWPVQLSGGRASFNTKACGRWASSNMLILYFLIKITSTTCQKSFCFNLKLNKISLTQNLRIRFSK